VIKCKNCGAENVDDSKFCIKCGTSIQKIVKKYELNREVSSNTLYQILRFIALIFGLYLISWGITEILRFYGIRFIIWPWIVIIIGLYVLYRILKKNSNNQESS
jgi:uncharacterized membrane protein YvbJ